MDPENRNLNNQAFWKIGQPLMQVGICHLYEAIPKQSNQKTYFAKVIELKNIKKFNLQQTIQYNEALLTDLSEFKFHSQFLPILAIWKTSTHQIIITERYQKTLGQQIKTRVIQQPQALKIFDQLLKAVFSLYIEGYYHRNLRPEHFVLVDGTWKLAYLIKDTQKYDIKCQYLWDIEFQPSEAYQKQKIEDSQADNMIVWNLGAILLSLLISTHKLKNQKSLRAFRDKPIIAKTQTYSKKLEQVLFKMLQYDPKDRMTIDEVFSNSFLSSQVSKIYQLSQTIRKSESVIEAKQIENYLSQIVSLLACEKGNVYFQDSSTQKNQNIFAVRLLSLYYFHRLVENLNAKKNFIKVEEKIWDQFMLSQQYQALKNVCHVEQKQYSSQLQKIYNKLKQQPLHSPEIKDLLTKYKTKISYQDIKRSYRKIISSAYREIVIQFNEANTPQLCRQAMYMTYCVSIDKTYEDIQVAFKPFFDWIGPECPNSYIKCSSFHKYVQECNYKVISKHTFMIWNKYFEI